MIKTMVNVRHKNQSDPNLKHKSVDLFSGVRRVMYKRLVPRIAIYINEKSHVLSM